MKFETPYQTWLRENAKPTVFVTPAARPWKVTVDVDGNRFVHEAEEGA